MKIARSFLLTTTFFSFAICSFTQSIISPSKLIDPYDYMPHKDQVFNKGAVASAHPLASKVGAYMLSHGGNAFDAAIATQLALAVVYPGAGNIGGGGFMVARLANGKNMALDFRETAPAKATRDMYLNESGEALTALSQHGHLASGIPGTIAGLFASMPYARLPFKTLIQPAIDLAEKGFCITETEADKMNARQQDFNKYSTRPTIFIKVEKWKVGDTLVQKDLANTLKRVRDKGQAGFYEGETANLLVAEMKRGNGLISLNDLKQYKAKWRQPMVFDYKGYTVVTMPPPSSGGILLQQMLTMVENRPLPTYGFLTVKSVQLMTEVERRAFADRAMHMGDPDYWKVPQKTLVSRQYLEKRMQDYDSTRAGKSSEVLAGEINESLETTHISIMDNEGNMVSVTTTLNGTFGSKTVVGGAGFLLNNEMDDFSIKPGVKNMYGAVGGEANAIAPGKRMLSSMTPTLVLKDDKPYMVVGTPGGTTIPTTVFQMIVNMIDFNMTAIEAVERPRFHHQWVPDELYVETGFNEEVQKKLEAMGYIVKKYGIPGYASTIGRVELLHKMGQKIVAVADIRSDDSVEGF